MDTILRVTSDSSPEAIGATIIALMKKSQEKCCSVCETKDCVDCLTMWHCARNSGIRILRSIFKLPKDQDVPRAMFFLASDEANKLLLGEISPKFHKGIAKLKKMYSDGLLVKMVPKNVVCPDCGTIIPPSRFGYIINGDPTCWDCEVARSMGSVEQLPRIVEHA